MKKIILGILALLSGQVALAEGVQSISAQQAAQMQAEQKAVIVDVRENDEWNAGHIAGAIHIPLCLLYTSPSPRDGLLSRMPSSA